MVKPHIPFYLYPASRVSIHRSSPSLLPHCLSMAKSSSSPSPACILGLALVVFISSEALLVESHELLLSRRNPQGRFWSLGFEGSDLLRLAPIDPCRLLCPRLPCRTGVNVTCAINTGGSPIPCSCCGAQFCIEGASECVLHSPDGDTDCGF